MVDLGGQGTGWQGASSSSEKRPNDELLAEIERLRRLVVHGGMAQVLWPQCADCFEVHQMVQQATNGAGLAHDRFIVRCADGHESEPLTFNLAAQQGGHVDALDGCGPHTFRLAVSRG